MTSLHPQAAKRRRWRLTVFVLAALLGSYVVAYLGASRSGYLLSRMRHLPEGEFVFGSVTGRPDPDPVGHELAAVVFWPLWRLEHASGGPRPSGFSVAPRRARQELPFVVTYVVYGPGGPGYQIAGRSITQRGKETWLTESQAVLLRNWWNEHDPLSLPPPDCEEERGGKYGSVRTVLHVEGPGVGFIWSGTAPRLGAMPRRGPR